MSRRPDVALVTTGWPVQHPRHYHLFARALASAGLRPVVLGQPDRDPQTVHTVDEDIDVVLLPRRGRMNRLLFSPPFALVKAFRTGAPVIQVNSIDLLPWAAVAARLTRRRIVYDAYDDYPAQALTKEWVPRCLRKPLSKTVAWAEPLLAANVDAVIFATESTGSRFRTRSCRILVVRNFPWPEFAEVPPLAESECAFDILYHGVMHEYYFAPVLAAAKTLRERGHRPSWCLAVREFDPARRAGIESRLAQAGLADDFTILVNTPFAEMPSLLARSRIGFVPGRPDPPTLQRSLPRKLFELLAAGRPAVVAETEALTDLFRGSDVCRFYPIDDWDAAADELERLLLDKELCGELGERSRQVWTQRFSAEIEIRPYVKLIEELARSAGRG